MLKSIDKINYILSFHYVFVFLNVCVLVLFCRNDYYFVFLYIILTIRYPEISIFN